MNSPADTFAAFVSVLSDALDEHATTPADLADRLHLSRSHLDHLVSAVAGESPSRLRRRVLLERAAWQLQTSNRTVLEIAIEAGYGSHEAFTRAFTGAYGQSPAGWRSNPTAVRLPSANGVHFHPPAGLRLPSPERPAAMAPTLISTMIEHHQSVVRTMINRARRLSDDQLDRPIEISVAGIDCDPTIRKLLSRLVGQMDMWNTVIAMGDYDFSIEDHETLDDLDNRLGRVAPIFLDQVRDVDAGDRWTETFVDTYCEPPRVFTYGGMVAHVITYAAHRRTLVAGALESCGVKDVQDDPIEWVDDHG